MTAPLLEIAGPDKVLPGHAPALFLRRQTAWVKAVDGIDFAIDAGRDARADRRVRLRQDHHLQADPAAGDADRGQRSASTAQDIADAARGRTLMRYRRAVQVVFQDPYSSLSPRMRVGDIIAEPLEIHTDLSRAAACASGSPRCCELVGLQPDVANLFPHEFSGGQRQRIAIARALVDQHAADRARRAGLGARRVDPRADHEPARASAGRRWA